MTGKEMCDFIAKHNIMEHDDGTPFTAEDYWNYSPTGELAMVYVWYEMALALETTP